MSIIENIYRDDCRKAGVELFYDHLLKQGHAAGFAAMLALKCPPGTAGTDRAFMEGDIIHHGLKDLPSFMLEEHVAKAKRAGISIQGKVYKSGLADQRGAADPDAWVSGIDDVLRVCKKRNYSCRGIVNHTGMPVPEPEGVPLSENIVKDLSEHYKAQDPNWKARPQELREMIVEKHGKPKKARNEEKIRKLAEKLEKAVAHANSSDDL